MDFELSVRFPDDKIMNILLGTHTVQADISDENNFPSPGDYFLAAVASCTAANARAYCLNHHLPIPQEVRISAHMDDRTEWIDTVQLSIIVGEDFTAERKEALIRAAETCWVKQLWQHPPAFSTGVAGYGAA